MPRPSYHPRTIEPFITAASGQFPVVLVTGARQVGKTTLLKHLAGSTRTYVTLDDPLLRSLAETDPALFLQRFPPPLLLDEIQYAPGLLPHLKMAVDDGAPNGAFWLTGSQVFHLMHGVAESLAGRVAESLAGRVAVVHLTGLSRREALGLSPADGPFIPEVKAIAPRLKKSPLLDETTLYAMAWRGSYPAAALDPDVSRDLFYGSYVQTYLQRDVRDLARVGDEAAFLRFLRAAAARTGSLLNSSDLARDADIAPNTARSWLSILETSGVVHLLQPWHTNVTKRLVRRPKLYFLDTGLAAWLTAWSSPQTLAAGAMAGPVFETWVVGEILKSFLHRGLTPPLFFYRDRDCQEVDLVIFRDGVLHPVEIKKTARPGRNDVRAFASLERLGMPVGEGGLICLAPTALPLSPGVSTIPASAL